MQFHLHQFLELFHFDKQLVKKAFKSGALPFIVNYELRLRIQENSSNSSDNIIHKIVFSSFLGGNPILAENTSGNFVHLQDKGNASQMVFTEKEKK